MSNNNRVKANERVAFVGKTGSGKTFAAMLMLASIPRVIVCDPKGTLAGNLDLQEWNKNNVRKFENGDDIRLRIPAPIDNNWEPYFETCYETGNCTVYIDELYGVLNMRRLPPRYLTALYTRGRELNIGVWSATQRPTWVPLFALSEADWLFVFRLQLDADRRRMAEIMGSDVRDRELHNHEVLVYHQEWEQARFFTRISAQELKGKIA
jgi:ABC-type dipeptide/oligopeptide/nickel transport system ATPase component